MERNKRKSNNRSNSDNYEKKKISLGIVEEGEDFLSGEFFPIELNLDYLNSISFKKGCFIGQEVTSRMYRKGKPKKRVFSITSNRKINKVMIFLLKIKKLEQLLNHSKIRA